MVRHSPHVRLFVVPVTLVSFLAACYKYTPVEQPYSEAMAEGEPDQLRLTVDDGSTYTVKEPTIEGETLTGQFTPCPGSLTGRSCAAQFALSDITRVEIRDKKEAATTGLIVGLSLVGGGILFAVIFAASCNGCFE